jgi:ribose transport system substrate-binding protein
MRPQVVSDKPPTEIEEAMHRRIVTLVAAVALTATATTSCSDPAGTGSSGPGKTTPSNMGADSQMTVDQVEAKLGPVPEPSGDMKFAYVSKTLINEYWQCAKDGAEQRGEELGVEVDTQAAKDESSVSEQLDIAQTMLSRDYDAFLVSPQSDVNLSPAIDQAKSAGMPVVDLTDARVDTADVYIGPDAQRTGVLAADFIASKLPDGGEVAQIEGQAGSPQAINRIKGFKEGVASHDNLELVASQPGNWDRLTALNAATDIIRAHPDLKAIYANNDIMALGVVEAVKAAGKQGEILVVGTDGISEAKEAVESGDLAATVGWSCTDAGAQGVDMALRILDGQTVPAWVVLPLTTYTADGEIPDE